MSGVSFFFVGFDHLFSLLKILRCLHLSGYFKVEKDTREPVLPQTALLTEYFPKY